MEKLYVLAASAALLACATGCEFIEHLREQSERATRVPEYVVSVHRLSQRPMEGAEISERAKRLESEIETFGGQRIMIKTHPFLHSRDVRKIELLPREETKLSEEGFVGGAPPKSGEEPPPATRPQKDEEPRFYDLKLYLTRRGALMWMQVSVAYRNERLAFLIDGIFYRTVIPEKVSSEKDEWIIIRGPFDETCARNIEKHANFNFNFFDKD